MSRVGFIISLDNLLDNGARVNWCSAQPFWTNQSMQLSGTSVDNATARVGDSVTVQVEVRGLFWTNEQGQTFTQENSVNSIQAWACYPNTLPGTFNQSLIVFSMNPANAQRSLPPTLPNPAICFGGSPDDPPPSTTGFLNLTPVWKPVADDLLPPNQDGHVCLIATCAGFADTNGDDAPIGTTIANDDVTQFDICNNAQQGQRNITILPAPIHKRGGLIQQFGFLAGIADPKRQARLVLDIVPFRQANVVDPAVLNLLQSGPNRNLTFRPANTPLKRVTLAKNPHKCHGWLEKIVCEAEDIIEDIAEDIEGLFGHGGGGGGKGTRLRLTLPPGGFQPLVFEADLDASEAPGNVHVFDVTQTDQDTGERGGYRIAVVAIP